MDWIGLAPWAAVALTIAGFAYDAWRRRVAQDATYDAGAAVQSKELAAMALRIENANNRALQTEADVNAFRLDVARSYVLRSEMERLQTQVLDAIKGVSDRLDRIFERRSGVN